MESVTISLQHYHDIQELKNKSWTIIIDNWIIKFFNMQWKPIWEQELDKIYKDKQETLTKEWFSNRKHIAEKNMKLDDREKYISVMEKEIERKRQELKDELIFVEDEHPDDEHALIYAYFFFLWWIIWSIITCLIT